MHERRARLYLFVVDFDASIMLTVQFLIESRRARAHLHLDRQIFNRINIENKCVSAHIIL